MSTARRWGTWISVLPLFLGAQMILAALWTVAGMPDEALPYPMGDWWEIRPSRHYSEAS
jgi:hypothetical protein